MAIGQDDAVLDEVKQSTFEALVRLCGGDSNNSEWSRNLLLMAKKTVKWTSKKRNRETFDGKPWDIEVRTGVSLFNRYKQKGIWEISSDMGLKRTITSASQMSSLLLPLIEKGLKCDINESTGFICVASPLRLQLLRELGKRPCPFCAHWFKGEKGVWWHVQEKHQKAHQLATEAAVSSRATNSLVVFNPSMSRPSDANTRPELGTASGDIDTLTAFEVARDGDLVALKEFVHQGFDIASTDTKGANVLHWAAGGGHLHIVRYLIDECKCSIDAPQQAKRSFGGRTALHWAARNGFLEVVRVLVNYYGANLESKTTDGTTPFCWSAWQGHRLVLEFLLDAGANVNSKNSFGCNACLWAAQGKGDEELMEWLDSMGCDIIAINTNGHCILHKAAQRGHDNICRWFLRCLKEIKECPLELLGPDSDNCAPSDLAGMEGYKDLAKMLAREEMEFAELATPNQRLPAWIKCRPTYVTTDLVWEAGAGVNRMRTRFHAKVKF